MQLAHILDARTNSRTGTALTPEQQQFHAKTSWLRPYTRWAAGFSISTAGWLPAVIRNFPLKVVKQILVHYQKSAPSGCKGC